MSTIAELFARALRSHQSGDLRQAEPLYRQILQADPSHADAHHLLGLIGYQTGHHEAAVPLMRRAIALAPSAAVYHSNLGLVLKDLGQLDEAIACYRRALQLNPRFADALSHLGMALKEKGLADEAIACYRQALQLNPNHANAHNNLGIALWDRGELDEAVACYRRALRLNPQFVDALCNLSLALKAQGQHGEAVACCRKALAINPRQPIAHNNLGNILASQGNYDEAVEGFAEALRLKFDYASARWNLALLRLLKGDFLRAWPDYEYRWQLSGFIPRHFDRPRWDGVPLQGKTILLYPEQGLGDTLQVIRYASLVQQRGGTVLLECQPPLVQLLTDVAGVSQVVPTGSPLPPFEVHAPLLSLPGLFGTTLATIPANVPYLHADPDRVAHWRKELEPVRGFKVGIVWQGSPTHENDRQRSVPLERLAPLAGLEEVRLVSLQVGAGTEQLAQTGQRLGVIDLGGRFDPRSLADAAAVLPSLDLVVTVDTAMAHLAGGLGVPVWVSLPFVPEWRWLLERVDSPWYPTMRLFRQSRPGDWNEVFRRIATEVRGVVQGGGR